MFIIPNATRWNAWYDAVRHVNNFAEEQKGKNLKAVCDYLKVSCLTATDYLFINEYVTVMKPIAIGLDILQGEKDVTSGNLLPSIVVIRNSLNNLKNRDEKSIKPPHSISLPLVDALLEGL